MDLILKDVQNEIGEIELGDVIYCGRFDDYYIVLRGYMGESYYLQKFNGNNKLFATDEYDSLESLRQAILTNNKLMKLIHYPAKEYRLELVKKGWL